MTIDLRNPQPDAQPGTQSQNQRSLQEIFRVPMILALLSALGLVSALVGDGIFDWFSWLALAVPVAIIFKYWRGA